MQIRGISIFDPKLNEIPYSLRKSKNFESISYTVMDIVDRRSSESAGQCFLGRLFAFKDLYFYGYKTATNITMILAFSVDSYLMPKDYSVKCVRNCRCGQVPPDLCKSVPNFLVFRNS